MLDGADFNGWQMRRHHPVDHISSKFWNTAILCSLFLVVVASVMVEIGVMTKSGQCPGEARSPILGQDKKDNIKIFYARTVRSLTLGRSV